MTAKIAALSLVLASIACAQATRSETFTWDPIPEAVDGFALATRQGPGVWVDAAEVAGTAQEITATIPAGPVQVSLRAFRLVRNADGVEAGRVWSEYATWIELPAKPPTPSFPRVRIRIDVSSTDNLEQWKTAGTFILPDADPSKEFVRLGLPLTP